MRKMIAWFAGIAVCTTCCCVAYSAYSLANRGTWPESWPKELEPLREQATTMIGPTSPHRFYLIPFTKQEQFELAWPHLLEVKSKGAPIILVRGPTTGFMAIKPAGVLIHSPPAGDAHSERPLDADFEGGNARVRWMWTTYIELVVDGSIVDLNRIPLPADTPIIDERFQQNTSATRISK
jgi:hypothetical protein